MELTGSCPLHNERHSLNGKRGQTRVMARLNWLAWLFSEGHGIVLGGVLTGFAPRSSSLCQYLMMMIELIGALARPLLTNWPRCIMERLDLC